MALLQGLKGDATYLIVKEDKSIEDYGLNAVCTHLGCVVPWNKAENKFICPCHGSQYDKTGTSPLSPHLSHAWFDASCISHICVGRMGWGGAAGYWRRAR